MELAINTPAYSRSSHGVRRYVSNVLRYLSWPGPIRSIAEPPVAGAFRLWDLCRRGDERAILWTPCLRGPVRARHHVVTVHDCLNVEYVYRDGVKRRLFMKLTGAILRNAEAVVAISHATQAAILRNYELPPDRIRVIPSGFSSVAGEEKTGSSHAAAPFVLWVTNTLPHKNCDRMCEAIASSRLPALGMTVCVVGALPRESLARCLSRGVNVEVHDWVSDSMLSKLYSSCEFLVAPSLDEGHNLAVAEAVQHGANVLCSDIAVHREYYAGMVRFFDPRNLESMVDQLNRALESPRNWNVTKFDDRMRSFRDVAADYRTLFEQLGSRAA